MRDPCRDGIGVSLSGAWMSTDLGCSSEYSMENIEGRSGEGFRDNSSCMSTPSGNSTKLKDN